MDDTLSSSDPVDADMPVMSIAQVLETRKSVRAFLDQPVPRDQIERLLRQSARAPSGGNLQPWHARIIDGLAMATFKDLMDRRVAEAPQGEAMPSPFYPLQLTAAQIRRRRRNGEILYDALRIDRADAEARRQWNLLNFRFFGAPTGVLLFLDRNATPFQWLDLGVYLQSFLLLLEEAGLAACPQADWAMYDETVRCALGVGDNMMLICGVAIGHADPTHPENFIRTERDDPLSDPSSETT